MVRGDHVVLVLEPRKQQLTTKYRSIERIAGAKASTSTSSPSQEEDPARARARRCRFDKKKEDEKFN
jgi:hypothetical protein